MSDERRASRSANLVCGPKLSQRHGDELEDGLLMSGVGPWRDIDIPEDMPVSRILRDYVANECGFDGYRGLARGPIRAT
jgi:hypothetical protein